MIHVPIHLSGGKHHSQENQLIEIFKDIKKNDWVLSTHRGHYHALLKGFDVNELKRLILSGESMHIYSREKRFFSSSIVGGVLPIAVGLAYSIKLKEESNHVWVFVGDMAAETGIFYECTKYAERHNLPITFIVEDNGVSVNSPTQVVWGNGEHRGKNIIRYKYDREWNHVGPGKDGEDIWVTF